ncbi:MAG: rRNA pseudouridine synthase [Synergistaceae bacterium]|nr:rRNA pseudouridine synthase [Synergistaceae bacterium]
MRLNAFLASCGLASRRKAEDLIRSGRVKVNDRIVLAPFFQVEPGTDAVQCDGQPVSASERVYVVMNKPAGVVCAVSDKYDPVVVALLPQRMQALRVWPAGRLDRESEGLLVLTNDGAFAQSFLHPSRGIHKEYEALLNIEINERQIARWREGFDIEGRHVAPLSLELLEREPRGRWVSIVIGEGLKREVRVMANLAGFSVQRLIRRRIGGMILKKLQPGEILDLSFSELYTKIFKGGDV